MSDLEKLIRALRNQIDQQDAATLEQLARAYDRVVFKPMQGDIDALQKILDLYKGNPAVKNTTEFRRLVADMDEKLKLWQSYLDANATAAATSAIPLGLDHAEQLVRAAGIEGTFRKMNPAAIEKLLGYLQEGSPLYKRIDMMAEYYKKTIPAAIVSDITAGKVSSTIIEGVSAGKNPKTIASFLTNYLGMPLTDSLRMTRTVQIWSYREASRAAYLANSDVVDGWIWYATLDSECCLSCIAQHGTWHPNTESLDDHYNGHCTALPSVIGVKNDITSGQDWFTSQDEGKQREIMGDARYEAWKDDKFQFSQLSSQHEDEVYGSMRTVTPLKDLLGE